MSRTFSGTGEYATTPDSTALSIAGAITLAIWVNPTNFTDYRMMATKVTTNGGVTNNFEWRLASGSGAVEFHSRNTSGVGGLVVSGTAPSTGVWTHLAITHTGAGTTATTYKNGTAGATGTVQATDISTTATALHIGQRPDLTATFAYIGSLAHFAIWNVALNADEVSSLAKGTSPLYIRPGNRVCYAPMLGSTVEPNEDSANAFTLTGTGTSSDNPPVAGSVTTMNNYQSVHAGGGMSVSGGIR